MEIISFSDHSILKQNMEYFAFHVRIALADGMISSAESELLFDIGKKLGFSASEVNNLIETTRRTDDGSPGEYSKRFEQVYDIVKMTLADGAINKNEIRIATDFAIKSGFDENEIPSLLLLLINGIKKGKTASELLEIYSNDRTLEKRRNSHINLPKKLNEELD